MDFTKELVDDLLAAMPVGQLVPEPEGAAEARAEALARFAGDDLVTVMVGSAGGLQTTYEGIDGFVTAWVDWMSPFDRYESRLTSAAEAPEERLLILTTQTATPNGSAAVIESEAAAVLQFRDGRLVRLEFHLDPAAARRAAGLEAS
jgi:hypothetical protein